MNNLIKQLRDMESVDARRKRSSKHPVRCAWPEVSWCRALSWAPEGLVCHTKDCVTFSVLHSSESSSVFFVQQSHRVLNSDDSGHIGLCKPLPHRIYWKIRPKLNFVSGNGELLNQEG